MMEFRKRTTHKTQKKQERRIAKRLNGARQPASGALIWAKGDAKTKELLIDAKQTEKKSISIKWEWLKKIVDEANGENKTGAISIEFLNYDKLYERDWILIPMWFYKMLIDELEEYKKIVKEKECL